MALQIEFCPAIAVEHMDQGCVADSIQRLFQRHGIADLQRPRLVRRDRHFEGVVRHDRVPQAEKLMPPGVIVARARRAEWHWIFTATGFCVM